MVHRKGLSVEASFDSYTFKLQLKTLYIVLRDYEYIIRGGA